MDHDYAFAIYFKSRKVINLAKLTKASPDQVFSLKKMIAFDKKDYANYYNSTSKQYMVLKEIATEDKAKDLILANSIDKLDDEIQNKKVYMTNVIMRFNNKIKGVQIKDDAVVKQLSKDVILDNKRLMNEKLEQENVLNESKNILPANHSKPIKVKSLGIKQAKDEKKDKKLSLQKNVFDKHDKTAKKNKINGPLKIKMLAKMPVIKNSHKVVGLSQKSF